jgi:GGDEF domain-containing protein
VEIPSSASAQSDHSVLGVQEGVARNHHQQAAAIISGVCDLGAVDATVTASIGIAVFPADGHSVQELLEKADAAMYAAKRKGQGPVFWAEIDAGGSVANRSTPAQQASP